MENLTDDIHGNGANDVSGKSLLDTVIAKYEDGNPSSILVGNTFTYSGSSHVISMCVDAKYNSENEIVENTLVPISDDWASVNWYARRADQLGKNIGFGWGVNQKTADTKYKGKSRDFSKEHAICNIQFLDQASSDSPITGLVNNKFRFTILPKPYTKGLKKMLYNSEGKYDPNGKFTLPSSTPSEEVGDSVDVKKLIECYKGLTVYEFNYDYVMSLKLFDAKVMATTLLDSLINLRLGINARLGQDRARCTETIKEIVKNIINVDDSEVSDCFYTFDNSKYDALLRKTEENRAKMGMNSAINEIAEILDEYNENAMLHEQVEVLNRAITRAAVSVSEGVDEIDRSQIELNFVTDLIENLTISIVTAVLSPKVLMVLEVNQQMMGGTWEKFTMSDLIRAMQSVIVSIVKEVRDLIVQELLKLVLKQLEPIITTLSSILVREQLENYAEAVQDIIRNCPYIWFKFGNQDQNTKLDTVDYADIDVSSTKEDGQPKINNC